MVSLDYAVFEISLYIFLGCFGFIPRKFQSSFIKDSPNTINSMWLFFVYSIFHIFSPFEMLFCIVREWIWLFHFITLFFHKSLTMPDFHLLVTTTEAFKIFVSVCKFPSQNFTIALLTVSHSWWLLVYVVLYFPSAVVLWHFCRPSKAV